MNYFSKPHEKSYERTYGWNWLLKLQLELEKSKLNTTLELANNLKPLSNLIIQRYIEFLPKLLYPVRVGTHNNTAFGLSNAWDYAVFSNKKMPKTKFINCSLREISFIGCNLTSSLFDNCNLEGAIFNDTQLASVDFRTAYNYKIDPEFNPMRKAQFSTQGIVGLLDKYDIKIV